MIVRRAGITAAAAALVAVVLAACAPQRASVKSAAVPPPSTESSRRSQPPPVSRERSARGQLPALERSARGNPPFYEALGQRYHVLESSTGYRAQGVASWYGREFHGSSTSSGETYDMYAMTAAHTTLPIPTWVEVTNLENGKTVLVKVNDRGPFVAGRLIDLSYAAARELEMLVNGTARVEVRAVGAAGSGNVAAAATDAAPPPTELSSGPPTERQASPAPMSKPLFVQVGAFGERSNAEQLVAKLRGLGFGEPAIVSDGSGRRLLHRVHLGPLSGVLEFDVIRARLKALGIRELLVVAP